MPLERLRLYRFTPVGHDISVRMFAETVGRKEVPHFLRQWKVSLGGSASFFEFRCRRTYMQESRLHVQVPPAQGAEFTRPQPEHQCQPDGKVPSCRILFNGGEQFLLFFQRKPYRRFCFRYGKVQFFLRSWPESAFRAKAKHVVYNIIEVAYLFRSHPCRQLCINQRLEVFRRHYCLISQHRQSMLVQQNTVRCKTRRL